MPTTTTGGTRSRCGRSCRSAYAGRALLAAWKPIETLATPPGARLDPVMIGAGALLFLASLRRSRRAGVDGLRDRVG
jgi:hypothetical protein